jgi:hypothetical protein
MKIFTLIGQGTYNAKPAGQIDRHRTGCYHRGDENDQRASKRHRVPVGCIEARLDLAKLEPAYRGTPVVESLDALRLGNPIEFK